SQENYWLALYPGETPKLDLFTDHKRPGVFTHDGDHYGFNLERDAASAFGALAAASGGTLYMNILAALNVLFYKYTGQEDIIIGSGVAGRPHADLQDIIGMFVNTLAMRNHPQGQMSYETFSKTVITNSINAFENQEVQFEELVSKLDLERDTSRNPLFDIMMVVQNFRRKSNSSKTQLTMPEPEPPDIDFTDRRSRYDMTFYVNEEGEDVSIDIEYYTGIFKRETIARMVNHFKTIIKQVSTDPAVTLKDIVILTEQEKEQLLYRFNDTDFDFPEETTITELFEDQAAKTPDHMAVVSGNRHLTYKALDEHSNQLAYYLNRNAGVVCEQPVGIMMDQGIPMIVVILGVLKAGVAFVPVPPSLPEKRIDYMLRDSGAKVLVTGEEEIKNSAPSAFSAVKLHPANLAYIIYTSGSTGTPKGVMVEHRSLANLCHWHNADFSVTASDRASKYAGFGFDASVWELFPYLIKGASIYIIDEAMKLDIFRLNSYFERSDITIAFLPTQVCEQFMEIDNRSLRILLTGGDKLKKFIKRNYKLINNYGPTESTVVATRFIVEHDSNNIPIGSPVFNTRIYIISQTRQLQPIGVPGELCIEGAGVSRGYLNQPESTKDKFDHDLKKETSAPSTINIYKTGDLARWLEDGNIQFLGRLDSQVKIRGYRIELGEIESQLLTHHAVKEAVVITREDPDGDKTLCAYIVSDVEPGPGLETELSGYLAQQLPKYMIPSHFVTVERFPLTASGKIDIKALPLPGEKTGNQPERVKARDDIEEKLVEIWSEVLGIKKRKISVESDFFKLGGHSLKASMMASKVYSTFDIKVPLLSIFKSPTIKDIANHIRSIEIRDREGNNDQLVLMNRGTNPGKHLFFIHDGTGEVDIYAEFSKHLDSTFNIWGIRAERFEEHAAKTLTVEDLASSYIVRIKEIQSQGPYYIAGWSLGGTIAFEIIRRLEERGEEVALAALIDSPGPKRKMMTRSDQFMLDEEVGVIPQSVPGIQIDGGMMETIRSLMVARASYAPANPTGVKIHYFRVAGAQGVTGNRWMYWVNQPIDFHELEGDHFSIFKMPDAGEFAE
ncbi:MAG: amino acid adenylation domain-containing protein, partial [bacterium]|nr:amino acid adenylation domain-containing protein [bacterium]